MTFIPCHCLSRARWIKRAWKGFKSEISKYLLTIKYIKNVRVQARGSILKAQDRAGDECLCDTDECIKIP